MADIMPNLDIRKMQINIRISEMELNLQRMTLRKMEIADETKKINENMEATKKVLEELKKEITNG